MACLVCPLAARDRMHMNPAQERHEMLWKPVVCEQLCVEHIIQVPGRTSYGIWGQRAASSIWQALSGGPCHGKLAFPHPPKRLAPAAVTVCWAMNKACLAE